MTEPYIDTALVRALVAAQFPQWANLEIRPVAQSGWDNRTFHLGQDMTVRLPGAARYAAQVAKEQTWLPHLAPHLPLPIPKPLGHGQPTAQYPFAWSVMQWISGDTLATQTDAIKQSAATDLAQFLNALRDAPTDAGPPAGQHNFYRGGDLRVYDQEVRHCLQQLGRDVDQTALLRIWAKAGHSTWTKPAVWVHGDINAGNLLCDTGRLSAVIDFGSCGVGDPACDLTIAWTVFEGNARAAFAKTLGLDQDTWDRAAGWCMWNALLNACKGADQGMETLERLLAA